MRQEDIKYYVHMTTDWVAVDSENLSLISKLGYSSQGYFPIGGECRKNMPPEFIFKRMKLKNIDSFFIIDTKPNQCQYIIGVSVFPLKKLSVMLRVRPNGIRHNLCW